MILIKNQQKKEKISESKIRETVKQILKDLACPDCEISILLVDDVYIEKLNRKYLKREGPTNVISFPMADSGFNGFRPRVLGDVVLSIETVKRQSLECGIPSGELIDFFLVHGILHIFGFDHETSDTDAKIMGKREEELMAQLKQRQGSFPSND